MGKCESPESNTRSGIDSHVFGQDTARTDTRSVSDCQSPRVSSTAENLRVLSTVPLGDCNLRTVPKTQLIVNTEFLGLFQQLPYASQSIASRLVVREVSGSTPVVCIDFFCLEA